MIPKVRFLILLFDFTGFREGGGMVKVKIYLATCTLEHNPLHFLKVEIISFNLIYNMTVSKLLSDSQSKIHHFTI